ncbi:MAG: IS200/IS605 family accessory protein TnpB-related protein [Potamolinea sp.]
MVETVTYDKSQVIEEPYEAKVSSTVLKTNGLREEIVEFNNQGYCRAFAKYKQGKSDFYWDSNLDRVQRKRNNQMRDALNKAARFIINQCLNDRAGNLVIGWNEGQKSGSGMGKRNNQNFVVIPTKRLIERLKQLCPEYGIVLTITEEVRG